MNFTLQSLVNLVNFKKKIIDDDFKEIINKVFEILNKTEGNLLMDSWLAIQEKILAKIIRRLIKTYLENASFVPDFKELFLFCGKKSFMLLM